MTKSHFKQKKWLYEAGEWIILGGGILLLVLSDRPVLAAIMAACIVGIIYRNRKATIRREEVKKAVLRPNQSVGDIMLDDIIENYKNRKLEYSDTSYSYYSFHEHDALAAVNKQGRIEEIQCDSSCIWRGIDLIGLNHEEFVKLYSQPPNKKEEMSLQTPHGKQIGELHHYDDIGLQLWVHKTHILSLRVRHKSR